MPGDSSYTMHEIVENYGPIVVTDQDYGLLISVNGSYFNLWQATGKPGFYENKEAYDFSSRVETEDGLYGADMAKVMDVAKTILQRILDGEE